MALTVSIIGVAFAAFCAWLVVRIVNRRERWAKWTAVGVIGVPALYVASFGPACWIMSRRDPHNRLFTAFYRPVVRAYSGCTWPIQLPVRRYIEFGLPPEADFSPIGDWFFFFDDGGPADRLANPVAMPLPEPGTIRR